MIYTVQQLLLAQDRDRQRLEKVATYDGSNSQIAPRLCPCCGFGFPVCAEFESIPREMAHRFTCLVYRFDSQICKKCKLPPDPS